jgi:hypothetical protein
LFGLESLLLGRLVLLLGPLLSLLHLLQGLQLLLLRLIVASVGGKPAAADRLEVQVLFGIVPFGVLD